MRLFKVLSLVMVAALCAVPLIPTAATAEALALSATTVSVSGVPTVGNTLVLKNRYTNNAAAARFSYRAEIFSSSGTPVSRFSKWDSYFDRGQTRTQEKRWDTSNLSPGRYTVKLGMFSPDFSQTLMTTYGATVSLAAPSSPTADTATAPPATTTTTQPVTTTTPPPTTTAPPVVGNLNGWRLNFNEDFNTNVGEGGFLGTYGSKWDAYPTSYWDTSKNGNYNPGILSVSSGIMNMRLHTNSSGTPQVAAPMPRINGPTGSLNQTYGRYEVRFRADPVRGYKTAWLLWPQSEVWPRDGEIDFPEGDLDGEIAAFMHRQGGTWGGDQDAYGTSARFNDWHVAVTEWAPNRVTFLLDGKVIGNSTSRVPNTPMRWVLQTETTLSGFRPAADATGKVQVDYVRAWAYSPSTVAS